MPRTLIFSPFSLSKVAKNGKESADHDQNLISSKCNANDMNSIFDVIPTMCYRDNARKPH